MASNREPYVHFYGDDGVQHFRYASGLTIALDSVAQATGGIWVAHGAGQADREVADAEGRVAVPPESPNYTLKRIFLNKSQENGYYYGFSNQVLWPLCHVAFVRPNFDVKFWEAYQEVNRLFAQAIVKEAGEEKTLVFLQDYHLALCAKYIKELKPSFTTVLFWHIPWPNPEIFRICPWKQELLDGLLANDILGFHLRYHADNFLKTVALELEAKIDAEKDIVLKEEKKCQVRAYPISVDFQKIDRQAAAPEIQLEMDKIRRKYRLQGIEYIGLGVDRIDYSKGIPERLKALDRFFELNPQQVGKVVFIQIGVPSRTSLPEYQETIDLIESIIQKINWKYSDGRWNPIVYIPEHQDFDEIVPFYRLADFCIVSSLHDGMNLVAKEYVSAQVDGNGVLILSEFTGSSRELNSALLINPYDLENFAQAIKTAVEMPQEEKITRMHRLREIVSEHTIYDWAEQIVGDLARIRQ
ncbi:MAG: trehalose-6-phosphate synthase [candidate division Zixibacteria bacterium RBG_16_50_21]|nr:MAG: trehalose-6-phosphate synthase [candidate division Zixibacteria bacterium RBG_16_50_21]